MNEALKKFIQVTAKIEAPDPKTRTETIVGEIVRRKLVCFDGNTAYIWNGLCNISLNQANTLFLIRNLLAGSIRNTISDAQIREIYKRLKSLAELQFDATANFWKGEYIVNTLDGLYDLRTQRIVSDIKGYRPDYVLNFHYVAGSKLSDAPTFERFVHMSVGMQQYTILLQVIGSCLSSLQKCRVAFFFIGKGSTGKSTILNLLESVIPPELVSHEPLHQMGNEQAKAHYKGKRVNIGRDTTARAIGDEESFKNLTSNEWTTSRELYQCSEDYIPTLKFIFASNHPIRFKHLDDAILDRMVIVFFPNAIPDDEKEPNLREKLEKEKDVIFSLCLDSLKQLVNSNYTYQMGDVAQEYIYHQRMMLHSVENFIGEKLDIRPEGSISSAELNKFYISWCQDNSIPPLDKMELFEKLALYHPEIKRAKIGSSYKRVWGFKGVAYRIYTGEEEHDD